jgi:hypothetical protein
VPIPLRIIIYSKVIADSKDLGERLRSFAEIELRTYSSIDDGCFEQAPSPDELNVFLVPVQPTQSTVCFLPSGYCSAANLEACKRLSRSKTPPLVVFWSKRAEADASLTPGFISRIRGIDPIICTIPRHFVCVCRADGDRRAPIINRISRGYALLRCQEKSEDFRPLAAEWAKPCVSGG